MTRYRATLAYDGTAYQGFQRQIGETPTIQLAVEQAITQVTKQPVGLMGAGRTDTGVHATGQVIAFDVDWEQGTPALLRAINAVLPNDISLQNLTETTADFHPRFSATSRLYLYRVIQAAQRQPLLHNVSWYVRGTLLESTPMEAAAKLLLGEHDFAALGQAPHGNNTVRTVYRSEWDVQPQVYGLLWTYTVEANAFLQHMVRRMVWLLVNVGRGRITLDEFEAIIASRDLTRVKGLAPPGGLTLEFVQYND